MSQDFLSAADRAYFRTMMRRQINSAVHRRVNTLLLLGAGWSVGDVAQALFLDEGTVRAHRRLYQEGGRDGIEQLDYLGGRPLLSPEELIALKEHVIPAAPVFDRCRWYYAPNLNLIERFWGFLKKHVIWNHYYQTFAEFRDAIEGFFQNIGSYRDDPQVLLYIDSTLSGIHRSRILVSFGYIRSISLRQTRRGSASEIFGDGTGCHHRMLH